MTRHGLRALYYDDRPYVRASYGLATSEEMLRRELKALRVPERDWPSHWTAYSGACMHVFAPADPGEHRNTVIVCIDDSRAGSPIQIAALLAHEAVHVWQDAMRDIGERSPSDEFEAYGIQRIAQNLMYSYRDSGVRADTGTLMATAAEFQEAARDAAQITHMLAGERLAVLAATPGLDPDVAIKIFNATKDVAQAVPDKKFDPALNLATFHISFVNGRLSGPGTVTPAVDVAQVLDAFDMDETFDVVPTLEMVNLLHINQDITAGFEEQA